MMWGAPLAIVVVLSWLLWQDTHRYAPEKPLGPTPLEIEVVGLNWKWLFPYPGERVASLGDLVIPAGQPLTLKLTSDTVIWLFH
jgi:cytochrome o ubiquinol oxidase subunit 2